MKSRGVKKKRASPARAGIFKNYAMTAAVAETTHRAGISYCPYCDHVPDRRERYSLDAHMAWLKFSRVRAVYLKYPAPFSKYDAVPLESACPKCFENSWVHCSAAFVESLVEFCGWKKIDVRPLSKALNRQQRDHEKWLAECRR